MSLRLWRRAPAWRAWLIAAIAFTALAMMFPPSWPAWLPALPAPGSPHFVAPPAASPAEYGQLELPPPGPARSGVIPFSGHRLPLPAGSWQDLVLAQGSGAAAVQVELLARLEDQHLTGIVLAAAPSPLGNATGGFGASCNQAHSIVHQDIPVPGANPLAHECWTVSSVDMANNAGPSKTDEVLQRGLDRLQQMGITVPGHMLLLSYLRSDENGWLTVLLLLPDRNEEQRRRMEGWARRFAPLLHRGYEGTLSLGELSANPREPD